MTEVSVGLRVASSMQVAKRQEKKIYMLVSDINYEEIRT